MSESNKHVLRILLILSPIGLAWLLSPMSHDTSGLRETIVLVLSVIVGAPLVAVVGLIVSAMGAKSADASTYSILGYVISAVFTCGFVCLFFFA